MGNRRKIHWISSWWRVKEPSTLSLRDQANFTTTRTKVINVSSLLFKSDEACQKGARRVHERIMMVVDHIGLFTR
jgi:hypothetical protein